MADGRPAPGPDDGGPAPGPDDGGLLAPAGTEGELPGAAPVTATVPPPTSLGEQPDATAYDDLPSAAPVVGAVRKLPEPRLARATRHRAAAVTFDGVQVDDLHVSAASIIGASHVAAGGVRQDAYNFVATQDGHLVVAIADGLGSRPLSQLGAALFSEGAIQAALDVHEHAPPTADELLVRGAEYAAAAARGFYQVSLADIAFVAAVAVFGPAEPGQGRMAEIARVGDVSAFAAGPAVAGAEHGSERPACPLTELFAGEDGPLNVVSESLPAAVVPVPQTARVRARILALVTDGLANDLRTSPGVRSWLSQRWVQPIGPFAFGDSLRYQRQGSHDDRTAVVIWQAAPANADARAADGHT
jgi:hypothetical protein